MTQEDKQLLLKDLCTRLPYGVKGLALGGRDDTISVLVPGEYPWVKTDTGLVCHLGTGQFKPYLRPMSSMTEEEEDEYIKCGFKDIAESGEIVVPTRRIDFLNAHHFDYRIDPSTGKTLIESGLAIEAPEGMYK